MQAFDGHLGDLELASVSFACTVLAGFNYGLLAFAGPGEFVKLYAASGVMLCLKNWYYRILILLTGNLKNAAVAVDALSIWVRDEYLNKRCGASELTLKKLKR
ncbi:hypothetical protein BAE44_0014780 [Dichanthelium oligosanthes]|uniref:Uncharacterized protein n=1 Tax=Dichanthelium oligosanthes TaxID=888268 RepID=A0A1E5VGE4_9POAL|nr:hypothetical protein BAE44_0014780 [Dichanthelium oligosanthes]